MSKTKVTHWRDCHSAKRDLKDGQGHGSAERETETRTCASTDHWITTPNEIGESELKEN